jgi:hypothetical protein
VSDGVDLARNSLVLQEPFFFMVGGFDKDAGCGAQYNSKEALRDLWSYGCKCEINMST